MANSACWHVMEESRIFLVRLLFRNPALLVRDTVPCGKAPVVNLMQDGSGAVLGGAWKV